MDSPCVSSESEQSINLDDVTCIPDDDNREPLATEEEAARYNADMEREAEIEEVKVKFRCSLLLIFGGVWDYLNFKETAKQYKQKNSLESYETEIKILPHPGLA